MTDDDLKKLQQRNAQRVAETISKMGTKYTCHPVHLVPRHPVQLRANPQHEIPPVVLFLRKRATT